MLPIQDVGSESADSAIQLFYENKITVFTDRLKYYNDDSAIHAVFGLTNRISNDRIVMVNLKSDDGVINVSLDSVINSDFEMIIPLENFFQ